MANVDHISTGGFSVIETVRRAFAPIVESYSQYRVFKSTYDELSNLTTKELSDIGIGRGDITRVAYDAAYGDTSEYRAR